MTKSEFIIQVRDDTPEAMWRDYEDKEAFDDCDEAFQTMKAIKDSGLFSWVRLILRTETVIA